MIQILEPGLQAFIKIRKEFSLIFKIQWPTLHPYVQLLRTEKKLPNVLTEKSLTLQVKLMTDQLR